MAYKVSILPAALRQLAHLPRPDQNRIKGKIDSLAVSPRPPGVKRLQGKRDFFRLRSGNYRVIYAVEDDSLEVLVVSVGHRREIYRAL